MKTRMIITFLLSLTACTGLSESDLLGELTLNTKYGYTSLSFVDAKTNVPFLISPGKYKISFEHGILGLRSPRVVVQNLQGYVVGRLAIPSDAFNSDGGFEFYSKDHGNTNHFNILGGKRRQVLSRQFQALNDQYCTYTTTESCIKYDSEGKAYSSTCTVTKSGDRDELWKVEKVQYFYRILFDAQDFYNVGEFVANSKIKEERSMIESDTCR